MTLSLSHDRHPWLERPGFPRRGQRDKTSWDYRLSSWPLEERRTSKRPPRQLDGQMSMGTDHSVDSLAERSRAWLAAVN